jgi:thiol-disulfide isomerase/thioredoxin
VRPSTYDRSRQPLAERITALDPVRIQRAVAACAGLALLALLLLSPALARAAAPEGVGADPAAMRRALDAHVLQTVDGVRLPMGSLRGEIVVVNFWASWCRPCRKELPVLDALHASLKGRGARVVAISIDEDPRNVERFVKANRLTLPVYHDGPEGLARKLDLQHLPLTLVLDRRGEVVWTMSGSDRAALDALARKTESLIAPAQALSLPREGEGE